MENVFKEICRQYIGKVIWSDFDGDRNLIPGHWWGLDMTTGMSAEIDIMLKMMTESCYLGCVAGLKRKWEWKTWKR